MPLPEPHSQVLRESIGRRCRRSPVAREHTDLAVGRQSSVVDVRRSDVGELVVEDPYLRVDVGVLLRVARMLRVLEAEHVQLVAELRLRTHDELLAPLPTLRN